MSTAIDSAAKNTDREIWRRIPGDYYSPSIFVTEKGGIGINIGGHVIVAPIERWHEALRYKDASPISEKEKK